MDKTERLKKYKPRLIDSLIERYLTVFGAICIEGSKCCGKTWTSSFHTKSEFYVGNPNVLMLKSQRAGLSSSSYRTSCLRRKGFSTH